MKDPVLQNARLGQIMCKAKGHCAETELSVIRQKTDTCQGSRLLIRQPVFKQKNADIVPPSAQACDGAYQAGGRKLGHLFTRVRV